MQNKPLLTVGIAELFLTVQILRKRMRLYDTKILKIIKKHVLWKLDLKNSAKFIFYKKGQFLKKYIKVK